jgi:transcriptional regulator with XRE-family HTH domain
MNENELINIIGNRIKALRKSKGMSRNDFSELTGVSVASLAYYENQKKNCSAQALLMIAKATNTPLNWLCGLEDDLRDVSRLETYKDVFSSLISLGEVADLIFPEHTDNPNTEAETKYRVMGFRNSLIDGFVRKWYKMYLLRKANAIESDEYSNWVNEMLNSDDAKLSIRTSDVSSDGIDDLFDKIFGDSNKKNGNKKSE